MPNPLAVRPGLPGEEITGAVKRRAALRRGGLLILGVVGVAVDAVVGRISRRVVGKARVRDAVVGADGETQRRRRALRDRRGLQVSPDVDAVVVAQPPAVRARIGLTLRPGQPVPLTLLRRPDVNVLGVPRVRTKGAAGLVFLSMCLHLGATVVACR